MAGRGYHERSALWSLLSQDMRGVNQEILQALTNFGLSNARLLRSDLPAIEMDSIKHPPFNVSLNFDRDSQFFKLGVYLDNDNIVVPKEKKIVGESLANIINHMTKRTDDYKDIQGGACLFEVNFNSQKCIIRGEEIPPSELRKIFTALNIIMTNVSAWSNDVEGQLKQEILESIQIYSNPDHELYKYFQSLAQFFLESNREHSLRNKYDLVEMSIKIQRDLLHKIDFLEKAQLIKLLKVEIVFGDNLCKLVSGVNEMTGDKFLMVRELLESIKPELFKRIEIQSEIQALIEGIQTGRISQEVVQRIVDKTQNLIRVNDSCLQNFYNLQSVYNFTPEESRIIQDLRSGQLIALEPLEDSIKREFCTAKRIAKESLKALFFEILVCEELKDKKEKYSEIFKIIEGCLFKHEEFFGLDLLEDIYNFDLNSEENLKNADRLNAVIELLDGGIRQDSVAVGASPQTPDHSSAAEGGGDAHVRPGTRIMSSEPPAPAYHLAVSQEGQPQSPEDERGFSSGDGRS